MQTSIALAPLGGLFPDNATPLTLSSRRSTPPCTGEFSLRLARAGEWVKITGFTGRRGFLDRINGIGLHIGARVQVLSNPMNGKLLIGHGATRLFLGGGMAHKIRVVGIEGGDR